MAFRQARRWRTADRQHLRLPQQELHQSASLLARLLRLFAAGSPSYPAIVLICLFFIAAIFSSFRLRTKKS